MGTACRANLVSYKFPSDSSSALIRNHIEDGVAAFDNIMFAFPAPQRLCHGNQ